MEINAMDISEEDKRNIFSRNYESSNA
jgi:hypothetical protein